jgi:hypothetical protein
LKHTLHVKDKFSAYGSEKCTDAYQHGILAPPASETPYDTSGGRLVVQQEHTVRGNSELFHPLAKKLQANEEPNKYELPFVDCKNKHFF